MSILPYERLTIETTLTVADAQRRLAEAVEPRKYARWTFQTRSKPFEGSITGEQFQIGAVCLVFPQPSQMSRSCASRCLARRP